jgi:hypothetical protein
MPLQHLPVAVDWLITRRRLRALRGRRIAGESPQLAIGRKPDLESHLQLVRAEFVGASELDYLHAQSIVMLRRSIQPRRHYRLFRQLWFWEADHLLSCLSSRWLVSAADTLVDHARHPCEVATAMTAVMLVNTIKLYETERLAHGGWAFDAADPTWLQQPKPLFDGLTSFAIGRGDLISNQSLRLKRVSRRRDPACLILAELVQRMQHHDTVYSRFMAAAQAEAR